MKTNNYFEINVINIKQTQNGLVFLGKLTFEQLSLIHRLTERKESLYDPFGDTPIEIGSEDEEFQRQLSTNKLEKISKYVKQILNGENKSLGLFPTSIIVALDHDYEYETSAVDDAFLYSAYSTDLSSCFINDAETILYIPKNKRIALIVDGQHRYYGVKRLYDSLRDLEKKDKDKVNNFEFAITFLVGFDIYQVGQVFATVNFTQKPVNRSLYYDIFGSIPDTEKNDLKLAHDLALHLNNSEKSPIMGMIKMLGKGSGLFSQSFFVEKMLIHFKTNGVWEKIYSDYLRGGSAYKELPIFMRAFLESIKKAYSSAWPSQEGGKYSAYQYKFILCKTTGMGAFFRLIREIYPKVEGSNEEDMKSQIIKILNKIPEDEAKALFSKLGEYGQGAGEGMQGKLYKLLKHELELE